MYEITQEAGVISLRVTCDIDSEKTIGAMMEGLEEARGRGRGPILLDLSAARIVNTYGIGQLLSYRKKLTDEGRELRIRLGPGFIKEAFDSMLLTRLFNAEIALEPIEPVRRDPESSG